jgi:hypothetical protein
VAPAFGTVILSSTRFGSTFGSAFASVAFAGAVVVEVSVLVSDFAAGVSLAVLGSALSSAGRLRSCSDLKSVSYQPEPFKRKAGAEISFVKAL